MLSITLYDDGKIETLYGHIENREELDQVAKALDTEVIQLAGPQGLQDNVLIHNTNVNGGFASAGIIVGSFVSISHPVTSGD